MTLTFVTKFINIFKLIIISLVIFFWDLGIQGFDSRLLILILLPLFFFDINKLKIYKSSKSFYYLFLIFLFITIHYYLNLYIDEKNLKIIPKDLIYIFFCFLIIYLNLNIIRANTKFIISFFIFTYVISTSLFFAKNGYNYDFAISCTYVGGWHGYTRFFFSENSHLAMMSVCVIIYYLLGNNLSKSNFIEKTVFFIFLIISFINYTATFLVGLILSISALFVSNRKLFKKKKIIYSLILIFLSFFIILNDKECFSKIFKSQSAIIGLDKNLGLSGAVFVNSFNIAKTTLKDKPYGWGINRYESAYRKYAIDQKNKFNLENYHPKLFEWNLNIKDGSNNFSKIITEFGFFSIIVFTFFVYFSFSHKPNFNEKCFFIPLILTQLLRGAGYFNGGFLLCIILMLAIILEVKDD